MRFHHLGVACENHDEVIDFLRSNFAEITISDAIFDPLQNATVQMITLPDGTDIELISGQAVVKEAILFGNAKVAFLASPIGIVELVEE